MDKFTIEVPEGIRYLSDWREFLRIFPKHPHIMDKEITGCGFTEWCITNPMNLILCSPRNILLDNKAEQHPGEVYRVYSSFYDKDLGIDKDTNKTGVSKDEDLGEEEQATEEEEKLAAISTYEKIDKELDDYFLYRNTLPRKILVTYDSFHVLRDVLRDRGILESFYVVVDEFQSVFTDSRFKSTTEMEFVGQLQGIEKLCYLSATPMMDRYLEEVPEFKDLPYYRLDWETLDPSRVMKPDLVVKTARNIYEPAKKIIDDYKSGLGREKKIIRDDGEVDILRSREAIFYVNSVLNICQIISKNKLQPEECNILCARTGKNERTISGKLGSRFKIGRVPLREDPRKMFTFCTRTVYLGADFYSDNACSFILSDANIDSLAVDISLDLPQILGRQRLWENPWKNSAEFYFKPLINEKKQKLTQEEFDARILAKQQRSYDRLENYEAAPKKSTALQDIINSVQDRNYKDDYVGVNTRGGKNAYPELNHLVIIAEKRAFEIQQVDYKDRFTVLKTVYESGKYDLSPANQELQLVITEYETIKTYKEKLRYLCEAEMSDNCREIMVKTQVESNVREAILGLGPERLKALGYRITGINKEFDQKIFNKNLLAEEIYKEFHAGDRISKADIKRRLGELYQRVGYNKTAKATDIENWFSVRRIEVKSKEGFELQEELTR